MTTNTLMLKSRLNKAIQEWIESELNLDEWEGLNFYIGERTPYLMSEAAFNVLDAVIDTNEYFKNEEMLKEM